MLSSSPPPPVPVLEVRDLRKTYRAAGFFGAREPVVALDGVSLTVSRREAVALVGASGSGKSTLAKLVLRLEAPDAGQILLDGTDVLRRERRKASLEYRRRVQMVFQDPFGSLNPVHPVAYTLIRPLLRHGRVRGRAEARARALALLDQVGLRPPADYLDRHSYELSGGQRQRVAIARALAVEPDLLIADEPTSMLDVSVRMGILNLLVRAKREQSLAVLMITHDLASARYLADRIVVLHAGRVVEEGPTEELIRAPRHAYTRALLDAIPDPRLAGAGTGGAP